MNPESVNESSHYRRRRFRCGSDAYVPKHLQELNNKKNKDLDSSQTAEMSIPRVQESMKFASWCRDPIYFSMDNLAKAIASNQVKQVEKFCSMPLAHEYIVNLDKASRTVIHTCLLSAAPALLCMLIKLTDKFTDSTLFTLDKSIKRKAALIYSEGNVQDGCETQFQLTKSSNISKFLNYPYFGTPCLHLLLNSLNKRDLKEQALVCLALVFLPAMRSNFSNKYVTKAE